MPAVFIGHGSPMNTLEHNVYTDAWHKLGESLPRPRAVLAISAHWFIPGTAVTATSTPATVHDFRGFPRELFEVRYPAPGDPALARRVQTLLAPTAVTTTSRKIAGLRDDGVLVLGSGNVVHNLGRVAWGPEAKPYDWATEFNDRVRDCVARRDHEPLVDYRSQGPAGLLSVPTPDHYWPLLYVLALQREDEAASVLVDGIELASISMLSLVVGGALRSH